MTASRRAGRGSAAILVAILVGVAACRTLSPAFEASPRLRYAAGLESAGLGSRDLAAWLASVER